eukprot:m51a1_g6738 hypothetical protein (348) ;mRNA; r:220098-221231
MLSQSSAALPVWSDTTTQFAIKSVLATLYTSLVALAVGCAVCTPRVRPRRALASLAAFTLAVCVCAASRAVLASVPETAWGSLASASAGAALAAECAPEAFAALAAPLFMAAAVFGGRDGGEHPPAIQQPLLHSAGLDNYLVARLRKEEAVGEGGAPRQTPLQLARARRRRHRVVAVAVGTCVMALLFCALALIPLAVPPASYSSGHRMAMGAVACFGLATAAGILAAAALLPALRTRRRAAAACSLLPLAKCLCAGLSFALWPLVARSDEARTLLVACYAALSEIVPMSVAVCWLVVRERELSRRYKKPSVETFSIQEPGSSGYLCKPAGPASAPAPPAYPRTYFS